MKYLIDTDITSYYLRGRYDLNSIFEQKGIQNIRLSRITVAELEVLGHRNPNSKINLSSVNLFSQKMGVLEVDAKVWRVYSLLKSEALSAGKPKGDIDILQAATAKHFGLIIVTNNASHFEGLIATENWIHN